MARGAGLRRRRAVHAQRMGHRTPDLSFHLPHARQIELIAVGPEVVPAPGVDQLGGDAHFAAIGPHAAFEHRAGAQRPADPAHVPALAAELERRSAGSHTQARQPGQIRRKVLHEALADVLAPRAFVQVHEGQHRQRWRLPAPSGNEPPRREPGQNQCACRHGRDPPSAPSGRRSLRGILSPPPEHGYVRARRDFDDHRIPASRVRVVLPQTPPQLRPLRADYRVEPGIEIGRPSKDVDRDRRLLDGIPPARNGFFDDEAQEGHQARRGGELGRADDALQACPDGVSVRLRRGIRCRVSHSASDSIPRGAVRTARAPPG